MSAANLPVLPKLDSPLIAPSGNVSIPWYKFFLLIWQYATWGNPVGQVKYFAGASAPQGWLLAQGQAVSRRTFGLLFAVIGTTYGAGDGVSTFNLPDLRGRVIFGLDAGAGRLTNAAAGGIDGSAIGNSGGEQAHTLLVAEVPALGLPDKTNAAIGSNGQTVAAGTASHDQTGQLTTTGGGGAHNTVPPGIVFNCIIWAGVQTLPQSS